MALVGESGCGKSTVIKLVQRFYDAMEGCVCILMPVFNKEYSRIIQNRTSKTAVHNRTRCSIDHTPQA